MNYLQNFGQCYQCLVYRKANYTVAVLIFGYMCMYLLKNTEDNYKKQSASKCTNQKDVVYNNKMT